MTEQIKPCNYSTMFGALENALRNSETIVGERALYTMTMFVSFILIEQHIANGTIDFEDVYDDFEHKDCQTEDDRRMKFDDLVPKTKFSTFIQINIDDVPKNFEDVFYLLSQHPKTQNIFTSYIGVKRHETFKAIFEILAQYNRISSFNCPHLIISFTRLRH